MLKLKELQRWVQARILAPKLDTDSLEMTLETSRFSREERWDVYRFGYRERLRETLEDDFGTTFEFLGERGGDLVAKYIEIFPSTERSLIEYGRNFSRFLETQNLSQEIVDLAKLEWLLTEVDFAEVRPMSAKGLDLLSSGETENLRLHLGGNVRLLQAQTPLVEVYENHESHPSRDVYLVVSKKKSGTEFEEISQIEFQALTAITEGATLAQVVQIFLLSGSPELMTERMRAWMENCWIYDASKV